MFESPRRFALLTAVAGCGLGVFGALVTDRQTTGLPVLLGLFAGTVVGAVVFVRWHRKKSTGLLISGYVIVLFLSAGATAFGRGQEALWAAGGYGLAQWVAIRIWERHYERAVTWQDSSTKGDKGDKT